MSLVDTSEHEDQSMMSSQVIDQDATTTFVGIGGHRAPVPPDPRFIRKEIQAVSFMAFHTILRTSKDYYEALRWARKLAHKLTDTLNTKLGIPDAVNVFPYSVFYVFYEQYLTMWEDTL